MSHQIQCQQCGGSDFRLESGFYFCAECQLQSQDMREQVLDDFYGGTATHTKKIGVASEPEQTGENEGQADRVSTWEVYNYVLKGLVDELILLGAPTILKCITLQLWASYLRKLEVAFTSKIIKKKPKMGLFPRANDAALFYKTDDVLSVRSGGPRTRMRKEKVSRKSAGSSSFDSMWAETSTLSRKKKLAVSKKTLAQAEYEESLGDTSVDMSSQHSSQRLSCHNKVMYSKAAKKEITELFGDEGDGNDEEKQPYLASRKASYSRSIEHTRFKHVIAILRIALLVTRSGIHFGDLLRWGEEGYLSVFNAIKLIPSTVNLPPKQSFNLLGRSPTNFKIISSETRRMVRYLSVSPGLIDSGELISDLVKRYCKMLNLPDNIAVGVDGLLRIKQKEIGIRFSSTNFEGVAMAYILFSLKIMIGLDGVTEQSYTPRVGSVGVKWEEWCCHYVARQAERALAHHPTMCRQYPNSRLGRDHSLLSHWDTSIDSRNIDKLSSLYMMKNALQKQLKPLLCALPEPLWKPGLQNEVKPSGPLLAVLSEPNGDATKHKKIDILNPSFQTYPKVLKRATPTTITVKVLSDDSEEITEFSNLYRGLPRSRSNQVKGSFVSHEPLPDYNIWKYHPFKLTADIGHKNFKEDVVEKLPASFLWLLEEVATMIYQPPLTVYRELMEVEKLYC